MDRLRIKGLLDKTIEYSYWALFFFIPLILTPLNYELFEYNKMMLTYGLTAVIAASWLAKMVLSKRLLLKTTPLDIPIALFFLSQIASFFFSIDRHISLWGYYSRFHGGLLSTISYILLYYAFVSYISGGLALDTGNLNDDKKPQPITNNQHPVLKLLLVALSSGLLVSIYGILEHYGIDKNIWIQDVQNRVFSTLGQPNWLAAYLAILLPIITGMALYLPQNGRQNPKQKVKSKKNNAKQKNFFILSSIFYLLSSIFYLTLLYTKSRSGFLGFWVANAFFWLFLLLLARKRGNGSTWWDLIVGNPCHLIKRFSKLNHYRKGVFLSFIILNSLFLTLNFFVSTPFTSINRFTTIAGLTKTLRHQVPAKAPEAKGPSLETGGTESGVIRRIVWKGAVDITRHFPLFGTGVETFALAYYQFRPKEHNLTSEWDFLYNKAHNEYLNYAATTGLVGLGSYLLIVGSFMWWNVKNLKTRMSKLIRFKILDVDLRSDILHLSLFSAWLSILVTNFFGFSVVPVAIFFWLIPAMNFVLVRISPNISRGAIIKPTGGFFKKTQRESPGDMKLSLTKWQISLLILIGLTTTTIIFKLLTIWLADVNFARGYHLARADQYSESYHSLKTAIKLNPAEPVYHDEFSYTLATLSLTAYEQNEATLAATLEELAKRESDLAITISPNNVNFFKTRTRVFYTLGQVKDEYYQQALEAIERAAILAPTDAKVAYNLALIQTQVGKESQAMETLKKAISLKPNYREPHWALALFYEEQGRIDEAIKELKYILEHINPEDKQAREKLEEISNF